MKYVFIDESGDLGFSNTSSKWLLFAAVILDDERALERIIKKIWRNLNKKHKKSGELHASHEKYSIRRRVLKMIYEMQGATIQILLLDKTSVENGLSEEKIYRKVASKLVHNVLKIHGPFHIVFDEKNPNEVSRANFIKHTEESLTQKGVIPFSIDIQNSHKNKSIQGVDFVAWAFFRKYEKDDVSFSSILQSKVENECIISINKNALPL